MGKPRKLSWNLERESDRKKEVRKTHKRWVQVWVLYRCEIYSGTSAWMSIGIIWTLRSNSFWSRFSWPILQRSFFHVLKFLKEFFLNSHSNVFPPSSLSHILISCHMLLPTSVIEERPWVVLERYLGMTQYTVTEIALSTQERNASKKRKWLKFFICFHCIFVSRT